jgi:DNA-binding NtrC family response regulator
VFHSGTYAPNTMSVVTTHPSAPSPEVFLGMPAVICSSSMLQVMELVRRVAQTNASVLITGDSGTGKELVARALHHYSLRCNAPWVDVNCGALPEHLVESELFGYEKGAFSGADRAKQGLFELADTGTLFLDEVGELEPRMQIKLLRVLDGVPYFRLGGVRKVSVNARIITATNQDLEAAIQAGRFRSDVYHRLSQVHIQVPSLRERPDDVMALAEFYLVQHDCRLRYSTDALEALQRYPWPGNVRELRNTVTRVAIMASGNEIRAADLPAAIRNAAPVKSSPPLPTSLEEMERQMIFQVLDQTGGHHTKAAEMLGISRRTLSRKLKTYGVANACENLVAC